MCLQPLGKSLDTIGEGKMLHKCLFTQEEQKVI